MTGAETSRRASLTALLEPRSVAVFGASGRAGRPGYQVIAALRRSAPEVAVYPVTPRYPEILGVPCVSDLSEAPGPVDVAIVASSSARIEDEAAAAIDAGAKGLVIFGAPTAEQRAAGWLDRVAARAREAGVALLGPDTLGYVNFGSGTAATWALPQVEPGGIALLSQSGTIYWEANTCDPRLGFSFTGHTGLETSLTIADLMSYAIELESTRVVGIYVETIRDADGFVAALEAAERRDVPVVAMYAGRTEQARAQMTTHAGRLAGDRASFDALFRRHGVARADTQDEWWTTLALLGGERRPGPGGLAAVMDSGGGLAMFLDYAAELRVPLATLSDATKEGLGEMLGGDVGAGSAIDFWSGEADLSGHTHHLLDALAADDGTAAVMAFTTYAESGDAGFAPAVAAACQAAARQTEKPVIAATYTSRQLFPELMHELAAGGIPTLDGMRTALLAVRHALDYRDFRERRGQADAPRDAGLPAEALDRWRERLAAAAEVTEADAMDMLSDFGIPAVATLRADSEAAALAAAAEAGYPVVMKTDERIAHKADRGGVHLGLADEAAVRAAYADLAGRLGGRVIVAPMRAGVEVALGAINGQFGPMLMIGAGGTMIEFLTDRCYLLAPASPEEVAAALAETEVGRLLAERHGPGSAGLDELCRAASRLAAVAHALDGVVAEVDVNPVLVEEKGCVAVDALVAVADSGGDR